MRTWSARATTLVAAVLLLALTAASPVGATRVDPVPPGTDAPPPSETPTSTTTPTAGAPTTTVAGPPVTVPSGGFGRPPKPKPGAKPEPPLPDPSPQVRILLDQVRLADQQKIVVRRTQQLDVARRAEGKARQKLAAAERALGRAQAEVGATKRRIRREAVAAYIDPGQTDLEQLMAPKAGGDGSRTVLLSVTISHEKQVLRTAEALVRLRRSELSVRRRGLEGAARLTSAAQRVVDTATADQESRRSELSSAEYGGDAAWSLTIEGVSAFTPAELVGWFAQHGVRSRANATVADLSYFFVKEGRDEGVRGDMAFAQSILETGSFTNRDTVTRNNFAGIGHCDTCPSGFAFATPRLGVRAQIQLLKSYADAHAAFKNPMVDPRLRGLPGCCRTWRDLTHTWATDGNYGAKLMKVYREMLYWLVVHRGIAPAVGPA